MGGAIEYGYDAEGQLIQRTDAGGNTRSYQYDTGGRMVAEEHKLQGTQTDQRITYSYDADGQMAAYEQKDGSGHLISSASYTKDAQGRTTQSAVTYGKVEGGTFSFTLGQSFNADGQLASHTYPDGSTQTYSYANGQLAKVTLPNHSEITYGNYQWMQPTTIQTPGATKTQHFDALQRYTGIEVKNTSNQQILASRQYQYDSAGNITQIDSDLGKTTYGYDSLDRLTKAAPDQNLQNLGLPQELYGYDAVGNRTSSQHQPGVWSYNGDNQLVQYPKTTPFSATAPQDTSVTFTPQGHTAQERAVHDSWQRDYRYNAAERLVEVSQASQTVQYRYDPMGRRIAKSSQQSAISQTTYYLYSDTGLMAEANAQGEMSKAYGFNPKAAQQGLWSTDPIWQVQTGASGLATAGYDYLHTDHLGTPILATTKEGDTSWRGISEAFGATETVSSSIEMNLRFPGQYWDRETQSHYNFHRDYRPSLGRYIQSDPIGLEGGVNLFGYVYQNGFRFSDPDGHVAIPVVCVANPAICGTAILVGLNIAYEGCKIVVNTVAASITVVLNEWWEDKSSQKYIEWQAVHKICDNKGNPYKPQTCDWAKWRLNKAKACFDARKAWMDRWNEHNPKHTGQLAQVASQVEGAANEVNRYCCKNCEE